MDFLLYFFRMSSISSKRFRFFDSCSYKIQDAAVSQPVTLHFSLVDVGLQTGPREMASAERDRTRPIEKIAVCLFFVCKSMQMTQTQEAKAYFPVSFNFTRQNIPFKVTQM